MYYDVTVIENRAYEGIMKLPLNIIYCVASYWQVIAVRYCGAIQVKVVVGKKNWLKRLP